MQVMHGIMMLQLVSRCQSSMLRRLFPHHFSLVDKDIYLSFGSSDYPCPTLSCVLPSEILVQIDHTLVRRNQLDFT